jgi:tRNA(Ile)-lysidine synthase
VLDDVDALAVDRLAKLPRAVRTRVLRGAAIAAGCPAGALSAGHVDALDALVTAWHGQGPLDLPGGVSAARRYGRLALAAGRERGRGE